MANISNATVVNTPFCAHSNETATWRNDASRTFYFLKGYATALGYENMLKAVEIARELHQGQKRNGGAEYLVHPLRVCSYLQALQFNDDILLSAALLHDVVEDVEEVRDDPIRVLHEKYGLSMEVVELVLKLTKNKAIPIVDYYESIQEDWRTIMIKLSDRCNNISTMDCFDKNRKQKYIRETKELVLPLCRYAKLHYPQYSNQVTVMKYHITSLICAFDVLLDSVPD